MGLGLMALRVSGLRAARSGLLDLVLDSCPSLLPGDVGPPLGRGGQGEAYALGEDRVLKIGIARDEGHAKSILEKLDRVKNEEHDVFASVYETGLLCEVEAEGFRTDSGTAYYYVMERLEPLPPDDAKRASKIMTELADMASSGGGSSHEQQRKKFLFVKNRELKQEAKLQNKADGTDEWNESNIDRGVTSKAIDLFDRMTAAGVKHVDMNSSNIMMGSDGRFKLIDLESTRFGVR